MRPEDESEAEGAGDELASGCAGVILGSASAAVAPEGGDAAEDLLMGKSGFVGDRAGKGPEGFAREDLDGLGF